MMSPLGTKLPNVDVRSSVAIGGIPDMTRTAQFDANDHHQRLETPQRRWTIPDKKSDGRRRGMAGHRCVPRRSGATAGSNCLASAGVCEGPRELVRHSAPVLKISIAPGYCAVQPPSTEIAVPVIWSAAGEHRKATVPPSCAGETKSRDGCFSARSSLTASF